MAANTKRDAKRATASKRANGGKVAMKMPDQTLGAAVRRKRSIPTDAQSFKLLREAIDAFEIHAIRWCGGGETPEGIAARVEAVRLVVQAFVGRNPMEQLGDGCPDGYFECNGFCLPYQCWGGAGLE